MNEDYKNVFFGNVRSILREIREIKSDCGHSTEEILLAIIVSAILSKPMGEKE
jgi:Fe-S-cluster formation regulator IscX/YfhJ